MRRAAAVAFLCSVAVVAALSISYGSTGLAPPWAENPLVLRLRLARTVFAVLTGAVLGVAGSLTQYSTRNPLADPFLLGLPSGALLAVLLLYAANPYPPQWLMMLVAFLGALAAYAATSAVAAAAGFTPLALILAGVAVSAMLTSVSETVTYTLLAGRLPQAFLLLLGSFSLPGLGEARVYAAAAIPLAASSLLLRRGLDALLLGDEYAAQLGLSPSRVRAAAATLASLLTGVSVAFVGVVGYIGLIAPNMARLLVGDEAGRHIPVSAAAGTAIALVADLGVRIVSAYTPYGELPVTIVASMIGAPALAYLLVKCGRGGGG